jgi:TolA-binding protein
MPELAKKAKEGLGEIEKAQKEALKKIEELNAADKKDELAEFCKQAVKQFAKTPVADKAKEVLKELSKSSRPPKVEPEKKTPEKDDKRQEPQKDTAGSLLVKAKLCIENEAYEAARNYLEKIIRDYPDSPEAVEAEKLLERIEDEL